MTRRHRLSRCTRAHRSRGFTLTELLVALIAGLLVAAAAFGFSKSATRTFSQEARIASAQLSVITGFERLQADVARASYLSTPNMQRDLDFRRVCAPSGFTGALKTLSGLRVASGDSIRIAGSFVATDMFPVANVAMVDEEDPTGGSVVTLGSDNGPLARAGIAANDAAAMKELFKKGRILRVLDMDGRYEFGVIVDAGYANGTPWVKTADTIPIKGKQSASCGVGGFGTQSQASIISIIEYGIADIRGMKTVYSSTLFADGAAAYGDDMRTELVRREILVGDGGNETKSLSDDPTVEVVAEYAVGLQFGVWVAGGPGGGLLYIAPGDAVVNRTTPAANYVEGTVPSGPESVRAVEIRLTVRSREVNPIINADDSGVPFGITVGDAGVARTRTLVSTVTLENQRGDTW